MNRLSHASRAVVHSKAGDRAFAGANHQPSPRVPSWHASIVAHIEVGSQDQSSMPGASMVGRMERGATKSGIKRNGLPAAPLQDKNMLQTNVPPAQLIVQLNVLMAGISEELT